MKKNDYVWYAVYGSNLSRERFNVYIKGGKINTSCKIKEYQGCSCHHPPIDDKPYKIKHELYFAKESPTWCEHGVAFIKSEGCKTKDLMTLGRIYLITKEQFIDILNQENGKEPPYDVYTVDFDRIIRDKINIVGKLGWYTRILYLGGEEGYPVFTFTGRWDDTEIENIKNLPSRLYKSYIIQGIHETYPSMNINQIMCYIGKMGGNYNYEKPVKTRKDWTCCFCGNPIFKGDVATVHQYYICCNKYVRDYYCKKCRSI